MDVVSQQGIPTFPPYTSQPVVQQYVVKGNTVPGGPGTPVVVEGWGLGFGFGFGVVSSRVELNAYRSRRKVKGACPVRAQRVCLYSEPP